MAEAETPVPHTPEPHTAEPHTAEPHTAEPHTAEPEIGYADAVAELESILDELDGDEVDVDVLGSRVRRASELLRLCRDRIARARFDVEQVVAELEAESEAAGVPTGAVTEATDEPAEPDEPAEGEEQG
jgi:exodeoxyribonuclease VII small subunit